MIIQNRDIRQRDLVPSDKLAETKATVVGVGAIGRQVALQLSAVGVSRLHLVDFDSVEPENLAAQGFLESDLGKTKVEAVAEICRSINSEIEVTTANTKFNTLQFTSGVFFCCVDSIETRGKIFKVVKGADLFLDGRMSAEYLRILSVWDAISAEYYEGTLFSQAEAYRGSCTAKSTIYCANIAAGMMVASFAKWIRGCDIDRDVDINLLTNEMGAK